MESDRKIMIIDAGVRLNVYFVYAMFSCWLIDGIRSGCGFLFIVNDDSILRIENVKFIYFNVKHTQTRTQIHKTREREIRQQIEDWWNLRLVHQNAPKALWKYIDV